MPERSADVGHQIDRESIVTVCTDYGVHGGNVWIKIDSGSTPYVSVPHFGREAIRRSFFKLSMSLNVDLRGHCDNPRADTLTVAAIGDERRPGGNKCRLTMIVKAYCSITYRRLGAAKTASENDWEKQLLCCYYYYTFEKLS